MSIPHSLLALLDAGPMHGYGLKTEFEAATDDIWPLNDGQVYTTLRRLERDGLVAVDAGGEPQPEGQKQYRITEAGRSELQRWFATPVTREMVPRQELAIKLVFAIRSGSADLAEVVQRQRTATMRQVQEITRLKAKADGDLAWLLMLDSLLLQAEAEARWLDLCEARLSQQPTSPRRRQAAVAGSDQPAERGMS